MISVKITGIQKMTRDLATYRTKALPYAAKTYLNTAAFEARRIWQDEVKKAFTLRNQYTTRSILAVKANASLSIDHMVSRVGSTADFMGDQEEGALVHGRGAHKNIPAPTAAGQPVGAKRTKLVMRGRRLGAIHASRAGRATGPRQRIAIALAIAVRQHNKYVLLPRHNGGQGLFLLSGGQRRWMGKRFAVRKMKLRLLWDISRHAVRVPGSHTMQHMVKRIEPKLQHMAEAALLEQLQRHKVAGY